MFFCYTQIPSGKQKCQTREPRAAYGPPWAFYKPVNVLRSPPALSVQDPPQVLSNQGSSLLKSFPIQDSPPVLSNQGSSLKFSPSRTLLQFFPTRALLSSSLRPGLSSSPFQPGLFSQVLSVLDSPPVLSNQGYSLKFSPQSFPTRALLSSSLRPGLSSSHVKVSVGPLVLFVRNSQYKPGQTSPRRHNSLSNTWTHLSIKPPVSFIPFSRHQKRRHDSLNSGFTYCQWVPGSLFTIVTAILGISALARVQTINNGLMATCTSHLTPG
ncbi:hypothetical protein TNCV_4559511 [Trichonephila clavipes]|nr:hypothetical protein TNCV_4559511 [Trichonephila clavipes]